MKYRGYWILARTIGWVGASITVHDVDNEQGRTLETFNNVDRAKEYIDSILTSSEERVWPKN